MFATLPKYFYDLSISTLCEMAFNHLVSYLSQRTLMSRPQSDNIVKI